MLKYCGECGHQIEYDGLYCTECGTKLSGNSINDEDNKNEKKGFSFDFANVLKKMSTNRLLLNKKFVLGIGISLLLIIIFVTFGGKGLGNNSPTVVVETFINHSKNSEWEMAEELWSESGKEYLLAQLFNDERMIYQTMRNLTHHTDGYLDEYEITSEEVQGDEAVVNAKLIFDNGRREEAMFAMVKEDEEWRVFAFRSGK